MHVQGAAAHQEQEQLQVAVAGAGPAVNTGEEYAFSRYEPRSRRPGPEGLMLFMSAACMTMGFGALSLRVRRRTARSY